MPADRQPSRRTDRGASAHDADASAAVGRRPLEAHGQDPDPRFTLANERTFLAWTRTSLALVAAGLAVEQLLEFGSHAARLVVALPLMALGAAAAFSSYRHWEQTELAMRLGRPIPSSRLPRVLAYGIGILTILAAVLVAVDALD